MMVIIYNSTEIEENALIDDFLHYLDAKDRRLIKAAVDGFSLLSIFFLLMVSVGHEEGRCDQL
jgi:hypothetical protein